MSKLSNYISNIFNIVTYIFIFVITVYLTILSLFNTSAITSDHTEYTYYLKDNLLRNIVLIIVLFVFAYFVYKMDFTKKIINRINSDDKLFRIIKYILLLLILVISVYWIFSVKIYPAADQQDVQSVAKEMRYNQFHNFKKGAYLGRYVSQGSYILLSYLLSFVFGIENYLAHEVMNCLFVVLIYKTLADIGKEYNLTNFQQLLIILSAFIFPILILYTYFIYGSIPGLAFSLLAIKREIKYFKDSKFVDLILCLISLLFAILFRTNNLIIYIAMFIYALMHSLKLKIKHNLYIILGLIVVFLFQATVPTKILESMSKEKLDSGIPAISWVAMGLQDSPRAPGWYNHFNNNMAYEYNNDVEKQKERANEEINKSIDNFINNKDYAYEFFTKKIASTWNNPSFQVFWNIADKTQVSNASGFANFMLSKKGAFEIQKYLNLMQSIILVGASLYLMTTKIKDNEGYEFILLLVIVGGFLFHLFWETKAQYVFVYFILFIPYTIKGYSNLLNIIKEKKRIDFSLTNILKLIVVLFILFNFVSGKTSFLNQDNDEYYNYIIDNINQS